MKDVRAELRRLILDGLLGRPTAQLWQQASKLFAEHGEALSYWAFWSWLQGKAFPASRKRQDLIGDAVGGPCGAAIKALQGPAFRGYRKRIMKENDMGTDRRSTSMHQLQFPVVNRPGADGRASWQAQITCASCGMTYHHARGGALNSEDYFRRKGWEVGKTLSKCFCPLCIEARRKVVKMSDHVKPPAVEPAEQRSISREDGRLLSRAIEDHWDEASKHYTPGWSDVKLAAEMGVPIDWVKMIRERDFGGVGDDPGVERLIAELAPLKTELSDLQALGEELTTTAAAFESTHIEHAKKMALRLESYREKHNALATKVHKLGEIAAQLRPFDKAG